MVVFEKTGSFVPSALQQQLSAAGIAVLGVTCTADEHDGVTAVQIVCDDGTDPTAVDKAVAAYTPPPVPRVPVPPDPPVSASLAVQTAVTAAMATVAITSPNLTGQQKQQIQDQVTLAVQAVVDKAGLA